MTQLFRRGLKLVGRIHRDEQGAEMVEKVLIIGAIVLPLLLLLFVFRDTIAEYLRSVWGDVASDADFDPGTLPSP